MAGETITFKEVADLVRQTVQPQDAAGMPYIGLEHIEEGSLRLNGYGQAEDVTSAKSRFSQGDILFGKLRPYFRKVIRAPFDGVCSTDIWVVRAKPGIEQDYLFYWMAAQDFVDFATQGSEGTKMPRAKWEHVCRYEQVHLPKHEQRAIAHILGSLDDKIELNRRVNETLEAMARAIFKSWFVDFEPIPGHSLHKEWQDSPLGRIPKGWGATDVGALAEVTSGKRPPVRFSESNDDAQVPLWGGNGPMGFVSTPLYESPILLTGRVGTLGSIFRITSPCWPSDNTLLVLARDQRSHEFLYFQLKQVNFTSLNRGSTQPLLTQTDLKAQKFVLPPENLLDRFHSVVGSLFSCIDALRDESRTLAAIRNALLPKLLSGEIRIKDVEKLVEAAV